MFRVAFNNPQLTAWQSRLSRIPRWGWIAVLIGVVLPIVIIAAGFIALALVSGVAVLAVVMLIVAVRNFFHGLANPKTPDDGRRNVRIVVHSARVIDSE